jgi:hypothetical protein
MGGEISHPARWAGRQGQSRHPSLNLEARMTSGETKGEPRKQRQMDVHHERLRWDGDGRAHVDDGGHGWHCASAHIQEERCGTVAASMAPSLQE